MSTDKTGQVTPYFRYIQESCNRPSTKTLRERQNTCQKTSHSLITKPLSDSQTSPTRLSNSDITIVKQQQPDYRMYKIKPKQQDNTQERIISIRAKLWDREDLTSLPIRPIDTLIIQLSKSLSLYFPESLKTKEGLSIMTRYAYCYFQQIQLENAAAYQVPFFIINNLLDILNFVGLEKEISKKILSIIHIYCDIWIILIRMSHESYNLYKIASKHMYERYETISRSNTPVRQRYYDLLAICGFFQLDKITETESQTLQHIKTAYPSPKELGTDKALKYWLDVYNKNSSISEKIFFIRMLFLYFNLDQNKFEAILKQKKLDQDPIKTTVCNDPVWDALKPRKDDVPVQSIDNYKIEEWETLFSLEKNTGTILGSPPILDSKEYVHNFKQEAILFDKIMNQETTSRTILYILGPDGCGKTTLVNHQFIQLAPNFSSSLWIDASNRESIEDQFQQFAYMVLDDQPSNPQESVAKVKEWLSTQRRVLIVFDGLQKPLNTLNDFLPKTGVIIVTSRNKIASKESHKITLSPPSQERLAEYVFRKMQFHHDDNHIQNLIEKFNTIEQINSAIDFMKTRNVNIKDFLQIYNWKVEEIISSHTSIAKVAASHKSPQ